MNKGVGMDRVGLLRRAETRSDKHDVIMRCGASCQFRRLFCTLTIAGGAAQEYKRDCSDLYKSDLGDVGTAKNMAKTK